MTLYSFDMFDHAGSKNSTIIFIRYNAVLLPYQNMNSDNTLMIVRAGL